MYTGRGWALVLLYYLVSDTFVGNRNLFKLKQNKDFNQGMYRHFFHLESKYVRLSKDSVNPGLCEVSIKLIW